MSAPIKCNMLYSWGFILRTVVSSFRNIFNITGRLGRMSFILVLIVMLSVFINIPPFLAMFGVNPNSIMNVVSLSWFVLCCAVFLFAAQRIHDVGFSVAILLLGAIPYVGFIIIVFLLFLPRRGGT
jgi:uncharacterized membrane protein YhaH (DUF805 family)